MFPISIKRIPSKIHGMLEVNLQNGKLVLDTESSNYSYGTLQEILHRGLKEIGFGSNQKNVLVLGMGAGSIVATIREKFKSNAFIELVEIDPLIIEIARTTFHLDTFENTSIIEADALLYMEKRQRKFDLIIVDLFIKDKVPAAFTQTDFLKKLGEGLNANGQIIYNTMRKTMPNNEHLLIEAGFKSQGLEVKVIARVCGSNNLILAHKIH